MAEQPKKAFNAAQGVLFHWDIQERKDHKRSLLWYIIASTVAILFLIYSITTSNFLFALMILLLTFIIVVSQSMPNRQIPVIITYSDLWIGTTQYPWREFRSFYMLYEPENGLRVIHFQFRRPRSDLFVEFENEDPNKIRAAMLKVLPENLEIQEESIMDLIQRMLKI